MNSLTARQLVKAVDQLAHRLELVEEEAWIRDRGWRFLFTNTTFAQSFGESTRALEGRLDRELFVEEAASAYRRDDAYCVRSVRPLFFPEDPPPNRETHTTLKFPLSLPSGEIVGVVGIACRAPRPDWIVAPPRWLRRVRRRLCTRFVEPVSVRQLAARARVHPDHLGRSFKRHYGESVHTFVRRLRVQWSCWAMLEDPHRRLGEIALAAGFTDQSHFTREFRRLRGSSPAVFRDGYGLAALDEGNSLSIGLPSQGLRASGRRSSWPRGRPAATCSSTATSPSFENA